FDILHIGHIKFLEKAKEKGDILFVLLESDEIARKLKGKNRPVNTQRIRAGILSALETISYIVLLPEMKNNDDYDRLVTQLRPMVIAVSENDKNIEHKKRQAKITGARLLTVIPQIANQSTTRLIKTMEGNIL
ncbi:MAG: adenylyltransferase/cytidyltransferase family protein, partial [Candidatus Levyibacteriota bacterium]